MSILDPSVGLSAHTRQDTFLTKQYKGCYIHSKHVNGIEKITWTDENHRRYDAVSWRGAQLAITKRVKERK